jgi:hypothetical protein
MSKYEEDKHGTGTCPFCEKPVADDDVTHEYEHRLTAVDDEENDPKLVAWASRYCWYGWAQPGECRNRMLMDERLIEMLGQRDAARDAQGNAVLLPDTLRCGCVPS